MDLLPEWNGKVVGAMHRMYMTKTALANDSTAFIALTATRAQGGAQAEASALAKEMGVSREYASRILNSLDQTTEARIKVESALESFARSRDICFNDLIRPEDRSRMP